jgi:hypothetical protein
MALTLVNLDRRVRDLMLTEFDLDLRKSDLYLPDRLSMLGREAFGARLREAIDQHDDAWLADRLREGPCHDGAASGPKPRAPAGPYFHPREQRRRPSGGYTWAAMPENAPDILAEGEFNRFYIRGLCLRAIADGIPALVVYRAKEVRQPRSDSERKLGTTVDPRRLLEDLRTHQGVDPALGIPAGPNSGLSVRLP